MAFDDLRGFLKALIAEQARPERGWQSCYRGSEIIII
ncbi:Hypothetical protein Y17_4282 [Pectobacterium wasabiae CFBP 3304]|nr:Hypothetical protein Y17_4282 [Pectobacterium wasabiae CFBP 3304]